MACILWFKGKNIIIEQVAAALLAVPYIKWQQGEPQRFGRHKFFSTSGLGFVVSEAGFDSFKQQVIDATNFIKVNKNDLFMLGDLAQSLDEGEFYFDFGLHTRLFSVGVQIDLLPAEFIRLCGDIDASIVLSQYPPSEEENELI